LFRPGERARALRKKTDELIERVQPHFIDTKLSAAQRWAGYFAKSKDSLPYIGAVANLPHSIFVLGYGGNGIASSAMLAPLVIDLIRGRKNADAKLFALDR
jgi:glycine/D-amino acid oxidase-like deaminating enzyme